MNKMERCDLCPQSTFWLRCSVSLPLVPRARLSSHRRPPWLQSPHLIPLLLSTLAIYTVFLGILPLAFFLSQCKYVPVTWFTTLCWYHLHLKVHLIPFTDYNQHLLNPRYSTILWYIILSNQPSCELGSAVPFCRWVKLYLRDIAICPRPWS
jgi:hypothetical protein